MRLHASPPKHRNLRFEHLEARRVLAAPTVDVWYGTNQRFGNIGNPQGRVNIVGKVQDADDDLQSLTYSLNGGAVLPLTVGPNEVRLPGDGDFNVDIDRTLLQEGVNAVVITATDFASNQVSETVTVNYASTNLWPNTYTADFVSATRIEDVAQVVDGWWTLDTDCADGVCGVRTVETGYDRLIDVGNLQVSDYDVQVPVTVHSWNTQFVFPPAVGIVSRWIGHYPDASQPDTDISPLGAFGVYRTSVGPQILAYPPAGETVLDQDPFSFEMELGVTYVMKMRVVSDANPSNPSTYYFKIWEQSEPEPGGWMLQGQGVPDELTAGSILLVAHEADVTFGNVSFSPPVNTPATIDLTSKITTLSEQTTTTNRIRVADINFADDGMGSNSITLSGTDQALFEMDANVLYLKAGTTLNAVANSLLDVTVQVDDLSLPGTPDNADSLAITVTAGAPVIVSDSFNGSQLDPGVWAFIDPLVDATLTFDGSHANLGVPSNVSHDLTTSASNSPRIVQQVPDADFEVEAKFDALPTEFVSQTGIFVQSDDDTFIRFEIVGIGASDPQRVYSEAYDGSNSTLWVYAPIVGVTTPPVYLRVNRTGNDWIYSYSADGTNWTVGASFTFAMSVSHIGLVTGNAFGFGAPEFVSQIDYFQDNNAVNQPPAVSLTSTVTTLPETTDTGNRVYVADIVISDDGLGQNTLTLNGADAGLFEIDNDQLFLRQGVMLNAQTNPSLDVIVEVNDPAVGSNPDDTASLAITVTGANQPPSVALNNTTIQLAENADTSSRIHIADIQVTDDGMGQNDLGLSGDDAGLFEIDANQLFLKQATSLDFETDSTLAVTVEVDDTSVGSSPDDMAPLAISITDVNELPSVALANTTLTLPEDTDTSSRIKVADILITDDALGQNDLELSGDDASLFEIDTGELYLQQATTLDSQNNPVLDVVVEVDDTALGGAPDDTAPLSINVTAVSTIVSDEFNGTQLNESVWTFVDPVGNSSLTFDGAHANLGVPAGSNHDIWSTGIDSPRIMQSVPDSDFEVEAKFDALPDAAITQTGILVQSDVDTVIRFEVIKLSDMSVFSARLDDLAPTIEVNEVVSGVSTAPIHLRVNRTDDDWTFSYSGDGSNWQQAGTFNHGISVTSIGLVTGNFGSGGAAPEFTSQIDYFRNTGAVNQPPSVSLANVTAALDEDVDTANPIQVAQIVITDDGVGQNDLSLTGLDASLFQIDTAPDPDVLNLVATAVLDFETNSMLDVTVVVDDFALGVGADDTAGLIITVNDVNEAPIAVDDNLSTTVNALLNSDVLDDNGNGADRDPEGTVLTISAVNGLSGNVGNPVLTGGGSVTVAMNGMFAYTPNQGFAGTDSFTYVVTDGALTSDPATVTIDVTLSGDFNSDSVVDATDIDLLYAEVNAGTDDVQFDLTGDGFVTTVDVDKLVHDILGTEYGDANLDGQIGILDLDILGQNFGQPVGWGGGNFDGSGNASLADLDILGQNWGFHVSVGGATSARSSAPAVSVARSVENSRLAAETILDERFALALDSVWADVAERDRDM